MAAMKSKDDAKNDATIANLELKHAAELAAVKYETAAKDAKHDAIIASLKAHRHGVVPLNLRCRTQEMSINMPAIKNIWYGWGDKEPEENFYFDWDDHKKFCCDHVTDLEGKVFKLEDEVDGVTTCVKFEELCKINDDSPSKSKRLPEGTLFTLLHLVNADHNVTVMADDTVIVEANDDVKIVGGDSVHIDAHDDIVLKSLRT